jgi:serine protease Do/serine protease DegQ
VTKINDELRRKLNLDPRIEDGLVISDVDAKSPFVEKLIPNMVIIEINHMPVTDLEAAAQIIRPGRNLFLVIVRGGAALRGDFG